MKVVELAVLFLFLTLAFDAPAEVDELSPNIDGEKVVIRVKVPSELTAKEVQAIYRSNACTSIAYDVDGDPYKRDGYKRLDAQSVYEWGADVLRTELAVDGGGQCRWRLSSVTFGVEYGNTRQFGEDVVSGEAGNVIVMFDESDSAYGGANVEVDGDVDARPDYYPWVNERFLGGYRKTVNLAGEGDIFIRYRALNARHVYFEPVLHSGYIVRSIGPKIKRKGDGAIFYYPDGSSSTERRGEPSFKKLQEIRTSAGLESMR